jgi:hypothetical protein
MRIPLWAVGLLALLFFVPGLGNCGLFDWDEVNFAEAAREMLVSGEFSYVQIDFAPFWEKPPLFILMQAASMAVSGITDAAARFPNAVCGAVTLMFLYSRGTTLGGPLLGLVWPLVYVGSLLPQFYFRSGIIDPWFNLFIMLGVDGFIRSDGKNLIHGAFGGSFIGLAVLTKGPVALPIAFAVIAIATAVTWRTTRPRPVVVATFITLALVVGSSWFISEAARGRWHIIQQSIDYHQRLISEGEAGHGQPFYYHFVVLLAGCFPMSLLLMAAYADKNATLGEAHSTVRYRKWMNVMFWVVLIGFSIVRTKIIHYSSLCYFPMSFIVAQHVAHRFRSGATWSQGWAASIGAIGLLWGAMLMAVSTFEWWSGSFIDAKGLNPEAAAILSQHVDPRSWTLLFGLLLAIGSIYGSWVMTTDGRRGITAILLSTSIAVWGTSLFIIPKVYDYVQGPMRTFYIETEKEQTVVEPLGFRSYANLYYGQRSQEESALVRDEERLFKGETGQRTLFLVRETQLDDHLRWFPMLRPVGKLMDKVILERDDAAYRAGLDR